MTETAKIKNEYERGIADGRRSVAVDTMVRLHFLKGMPITEAADLIPCGADQRPALIKEAEESCSLQPLLWSDGSAKHLTWSEFVASRIQYNETSADLMSPAMYDWCISQMQEYLVGTLSYLRRLLEQHDGSVYQVIEQEELSGIQRSIIFDVSTVLNRHPELSMEQIVKELISGVIGYELLPELEPDQFSSHAQYLEDAHYVGANHGAMDMAVLTTQRISRKLGLSLEDASGLVGCRYYGRERFAVEAVESCLLQDPAMLEEHSEWERNTVQSRKDMNDISSALLSQTLVQYLIHVLLGSCGMLIDLVADKVLQPEELRRFVKDPAIADFYFQAAERCAVEKKTNSISLLLQVFSALVGYDISWYIY
jgi:hypothetical protein